MCAQLQDWLPYGRRRPFLDRVVVCLPCLCRPILSLPSTRTEKLINIRSGYLAAGMGGAAGIFALFFFDGVPRVQQDILQKVPFIGDFYKHEVPPEDNPF